MAVLSTPGSPMDGHGVVRPLPGQLALCGEGGGGPRSTHGVTWTAVVCVRCHLQHLLRALAQHSQQLTRTSPFASSAAPLRMPGMPSGNQGCVINGPEDDSVHVQQHHAQQHRSPCPAASSPYILPLPCRTDEHSVPWHDKTCSWFCIHLICRRSDMSPLRWRLPPRYPLTHRTTSGALLSELASKRTLGTSTQTYVRSNAPSNLNPILCGQQRLGCG